MNKERIVNELSLTPFGAKGWMRSNSVTCPFKCGKSDKFGILFLQDSGICKCMRCSESTSLINYLITIKRNDLIEGYSAPIRDELKSLITIKEKEVESIVEEISLPRGFKRVYFEDYLDDRGFTERQYNSFKIGRSTDSRLKNHIVFLLYQNEILVGWLARSIHDKKWHEKNLQDYKKGIGRLVLRYYNSPGIQFEDILGGYDEITLNTKTVILVEGLTDKANVDNMLSLYDSEKTKCCFTFGKNFSENHIKLLKKKGVENIVLMYDPDALKEIEKYSLKYINQFKSLKCARLTGDKDPGDLNKEELEHILENLYNPLNFYLNNIKTLV